MNFTATNKGGFRVPVDIDTETDYDALRRSVDLRRFVEQSLGQPLKGGRWPCPVHKGDSPNFAVSGERWKCFKCQLHGDVVDFLVQVDGLTRAEAVAKLDPSGSFRKPSSRGPRRRPTAPPVKPASAAVKQSPSKPAERSGEPVGRGKTPAWQDAEWQGTIDLIVGKAEAALWSAEGRSALGWLRARGLDDATIRRFRLGFLPNPVSSDPIEALGPGRDGGPRRVWAPRGVVIPWVRPGSWYATADDSDDDDPGPRWVGCNVRRLPSGDVSGPLPPDVKKYQALAGSERGHGYPWPDAPAVGETALVCEGEFDALVGWQEAGWLLNVVTFGGAGQSSPHPDARAFLSGCPDWLLMFDQDDAGDDAARGFMRKASHRCRRLTLPPGVNDLTDLHRSGESILGWLRSEWERFGWPWPLRSNRP